MDAGAIVFTGLGFYRLKVTSESEPMGPLWLGFSATLLGSIIIFGLALGSILRGSGDWIFPSPTVIEHGF